MKDDVKYILSVSLTPSRAPLKLFLLHSIVFHSSYPFKSHDLGNVKIVDLISLLTLYVLFPD